MGVKLLDILANLVFGAASFIGLALYWFSAVSGTCTQGDTDDLAIAMVLTLPFFMISYGVLLFKKNWKPSLIVLVLLVPLFLYLVYWYGGLLWATNLHSKAVCSWKMGEDFGEVFSQREYYFAPQALFMLGLWFYLTARRWGQRDGA